MKFQEKLLDSFIAFEQDIDLLNPIHTDRKDALKRFEKQGFPSKKDESWKYTSLKSIIQKNYSLSSKSDKSVELRDVKKYFLNDLDSFKIVFVDGIYSPFLSKTTHDGMDICVLSAALSKEKYKSTLKKYFNQIVPKDESLASLNTSYTKEGAYVYIPKGVCPEDPVQIMHISTGNQESIWLQPRNLIIADKNSKVEIIERHQSLKDHSVVTNSLTEIYAEKNAFVFRVNETTKLASFEKMLSDAAIDYVKEQTGADITEQFKDLLESAAISTGKKLEKISLYKEMLSFLYDQKGRLAEADRNLPDIKAADNLIGSEITRISEEVEALENDTLTIEDGYVDATLKSEVEGIAEDGTIKVDSVEFNQAGKNDILTVFVENKPFRVEKYKINISSEDTV